MRYNVLVEIESKAGINLPVPQGLLVLKEKLLKSKETFIMIYVTLGIKFSPCFRSISFCLQRPCPFTP